MTPGESRERERAAHLGPERRRPLLLDAALPIFAEHGFAGASIDAIAEAAGVTKPVVYACFAGKQELFAALLAREETRLLEQIGAALPADIDPTDLERTLVAAFGAYFEGAAATPDSWRLVFQAEHGGDAIVTQRVERARGMATAGIASLAEKLLRDAGVKDAGRRATLEARVLVASAEAAVRLMLADPRNWSPQALGRLIGAGAARAHAAYAEPGD